MTSMRLVFLSEFKFQIFVLVAWLSYELASLEA